MPDTMLNLKHRTMRKIEAPHSGNFFFQTFPKTVASSKDKREHEIDALNKSGFIMNERTQKLSRIHISISSRG